MTETRKPPRCHYDRALAVRVTTAHRDDCPHEQGTGDCPAAGRGCAPCTAPHCLICGREHATNETPDTCPECLGKIHQDLAELARDYTDLATEAIAGGHDGHLAAAAPIPGGTATVLRGPAVRLEQMHTFRGYASAHLKNDPIPPLAVLADLEDTWRAWFGHTPATQASVAGALRYFNDQLDHMANGLAPGAPDFLAFTRKIRDLRAQLERALHDEQEPEQGVECFECGDRLVRRFRDPKRCRHKTPARVELQRALVRQAEGQAWLRVAASYPELPILERDLAAARGPSASLIAAARRPCAACQLQRGGQGGITDPTSGQSWECPGCRKEYTLGEYHNAVRRDLLNDEHGWTTLSNACAAVATLTGAVLGDKTLRGWIGRGWVDSRFEQTKIGLPGVRVVFWPDVMREARRVALGMHHCKHPTPARRQLAAVETYPELEVTDVDRMLARESCEECLQVVESGGRRARGSGVA